jgi:hypothetical protein
MHIHLRASAFPAYRALAFSKLGASVSAGPGRRHQREAESEHQILRCWDLVADELLRVRPRKGAVAVSWDR